MIRKKVDVVADHMICFVFGREPLLLKPAPYFRPLDAPETKGSVTQDKAIQRAVAVGFVYFFAGGFLVLMAVVGLFFGLTEDDIPLRGILLLLAFGAGGVFLIRKSFKPARG